MWPRWRRARRRHRGYLVIGSPLIITTISIKRPCLARGFRPQAHSEPAMVISSRMVLLMAEDKSALFGPNDHHIKHQDIGHN